MDFFSILIEVQSHKNALCVEFVVGFDQDLAILAMSAGSAVCLVSIKSCRMLIIKQEMSI